jgi:hypothetical protein
MTESLRHYRSALFGLLFLPLFAASAPASTVTLSIKNDDTHPLRCMVVFAHWVTTDVGPIAGSRQIHRPITRENGRLIDLLPCLDRAALLFFFRRRCLDMAAST